MNPNTQNQEGLLQKFRKSILDFSSLNNEQAKSKMESNEVKQRIRIASVGSKSLFHNTENRYSIENRPTLYPEDNIDNRTRVHHLSLHMSRHKFIPPLIQERSESLPMVDPFSNMMRHRNEMIPNRNNHTEAQSPLKKVEPKRDLPAPKLQIPHDSNGIRPMSPVQATIMIQNEF
jgi:hypothetical protein